MILYYSRGSCSLAAHIVARETGLAFQLEKVNPATKQLQSGFDFREANPKGYVPALRLPDGSILTEVAAIVQYLADQAPHAGLLPPAGSFTRYRVQEWLHFIGTELHKTWGQLFYPTISGPEKEALRARLLERLQIVNSVLQRQGYLIGERFTVADAYLYALLRWAQLTALELPEALKAFKDRVEARPGVIEALVAERLVKRAPGTAA